MMNELARRQLLLALSGSALTCLATGGWAAPREGGTGAGSVPLPVSAGATTWPAWEHFKRQFLEPSGRVVCGEGAQRSTFSEGQGYALFFALLANDRRAFELLLRWTEEQLCGGDMAAQLPAWLWGRKDDESWGVLDPNCALDADLWIAYALGEAGRLWSVRRYRALSQLISARVLREETAELPGLGLCLLPGRVGFALEGQRWRLNASYLPLQLIRWFAAQGGVQAPAWQALVQSSFKVIAGAAPRGWAADWIIYDPAKGFLPDLQGEEKGQGGYNAIRVYLWAATLHADDPHRAALLQRLQPMAGYVKEHGAVPEFIDIFSGVGQGVGPAGFAVALLPFLQAQNAPQAVRALSAHLQANPVPVDAYYGQALRLFAQGWLDGQYQFTVDGGVQPRWSR